MLIFSFFFISVFVGLAGWILYLLYKPIRNRLIKSGKLTPHRSTQISSGYKILLLLIAVFQTYKANYPSDSFYFDEFESVTLRKPPSSAEVIKKASTYPDFHGDYCSSSMIKISKEDYTRLYIELQSDKDLVKNAELLSSGVLDKVLERNKREQIVAGFQRKISGKSGIHLYIGFLNDQQTIIVNKCSS